MLGPRIWRRRRTVFAGQKNQSVTGLMLVATYGLNLSCRVPWVCMYLDSTDTTLPTIVSWRPSPTTWLGRNRDKILPEDLPMFPAWDADGRRSLKKPPPCSSYPRWDVIFARGAASRNRNTMDFLDCWQFAITTPFASAVSYCTVLCCMYVEVLITMQISLHVTTRSFTRRTRTLQHSDTGVRDLAVLSRSFGMARKHSICW